jgi:hypothetical protein
MLKGFPGNSISELGMGVSKGENADELARNATRRRRFFFMMGNG